MAIRASNVLTLRTPYKLVPYGLRTMRIQKIEDDGALYVTTRNKFVIEIDADEILLEPFEPQDEVLVESDMPIETLLEMG